MSELSAPTLQAVTKRSAVADQPEAWLGSALSSLRSGASSQSVPQTVRIALLGCGTVGSAVARILLDLRDEIRNEFGVDCALASILVRSARSRRHIPRELLTDSFERVLDSQPDIIIEVLGGLEPARTFISRALARGISVITANKAVIAHYGRELEAIAARSGATLAYEAAVCAAIPVIATLRRLRSDRIQSITGIVNGSTNFMLTRMSESGCTRDEALAEAQRLGFAEPDPTADVSGRDSAEKLCILAREAGCEAVEISDVPVSGIESITERDILATRRKGYVIKLIAEFRREGAKVALRVGPALVPKTHRLAQVSLARNGLSIGTLFSGELFLEGEGAGPEPTASAILGDLVSTACQYGARRNNKFESGAPRHNPTRISTIAHQAIHYVRIALQNPSRKRDSHGQNVRATGDMTPSAILRAFRDAGVEIQSIEIREGEARIFTLDAHESRIRSALESLGVRSERALAIPAIFTDRAGLNAASRQHARADVRALSHAFVELDLPRKSA